MTEFVLFEMESFPKRPLLWAAGTNLTRPVEIAEFDESFVNWKGLRSFLKKHKIIHTLREDSVVKSKDSRRVKFILTIPEDAQAVFFKMYWSEQLSLFR